MPIDYEHLKKIHANKNVAEIAAEIKKVKIFLEEAKEEKASLQKLYDILTLDIAPEIMEREETESSKISGVGTVSIRSDIWCSCTKENKDKLKKWLEENGHGSMITNDVNSSTLKAFVKEQIKEGKEVPSDIVKVTPYSRVVITG